MTGPRNLVSAGTRFVPQFLATLSKEGNCCCHCLRYGVPILYCFMCRCLLCQYALHSFDHGSHPTFIATFCGVCSNNKGCGITPSEPTDQALLFML